MSSRTKVRKGVTKVSVFFVLKYTSLSTQPQRECWATDKHTLYLPLAVAVFIHSSISSRSVTLVENYAYHALCMILLLTIESYERKLAVVSFSAFLFPLMIDLGYTWKIALNADEWTFQTTHTPSKPFHSRHCISSLPLQLVPIQAYNLCILIIVIVDSSKKSMVDENERFKIFFNILLFISRCEIVDAIWS